MCTLGKIVFILGMGREGLDGIWIVFLLVGQCAISLVCLMLIVVVVVVVVVVRRRRNGIIMYR
jgi:hypothetical protein